MTRDRPAGTGAVAVATLLLLTAMGAGAFVGGVAAADESLDPAVVTDGPADTPVVTDGPADSPVAPTVDPADQFGGNEVGPLTGCFGSEGYPVAIGGSGAAIETVVHLSVLTDPEVGNEFGLEAAGTLGGTPIVTLAAGVRLTAREAIANGFNPFAAFDVLYTYELRLPMFDGSVDDSEYRDDGSPIDAGGGTVTC